MSVWDNATMVLRNSVVDFRKGQYRYQTRNIAHNNARLYCLNTIFGCEADPAESEPEAADSALTMVLNLDGPAAVKPGQAAGIRRSAWVKTGPLSPVVFSSYMPQVSPEGRAQWQTIRRSPSAVKEGILGTWQTSGLPNGRYRLRLTLYVDGDTGAYPIDQYPAEMVVQLSASSGGGGGGGGTCFISSLF